MAASAHCLVALALGAALLAVVGAQSDGPASSPPPPPPPNIDKILLRNSTNHKTFARLLKETQVDIQINDELGDLANTFTIFAPTDDAFTTTKGGALNTLDQQAQVELVLYHILPHYYSPEMFVTASNPVRTQASGNHGAYTMNVTTDSSLLVNISTGIVRTPIAGKVYDDSQQLAVYSVEKVLLPYDLFGPKPPPAPGPSSNSSAAGEAAAPAADGSGAGAGAGGRSLVGVGVGLVAAIAGCLL